MAQDIVGSAMPDSVAEQITKVGNRQYGQNGFGGPSSDQPGDRTKSGFLPDDAYTQTPVNAQMRTLETTGKSKPVPDAFGMQSNRSRQPTSDAQRKAAD
jgi:hypothetical protein